MATLYILKNVVAPSALIIPCVVHICRGIEDDEDLAESTRNVLVHMIQSLKRTGSESQFRFLHRGICCVDANLPTVDERFRTCLQ